MVVERLVGVSHRTNPLTLRIVVLLSFLVLVLLNPAPCYATDTSNSSLGSSSDGGTPALPEVSTASTPNPTLASEAPLPHQLSSDPRTCASRDANGGPPIPAPFEDSYTLQRGTINNIVLNVPEGASGCAISFWCPVQEPSPGITLDFIDPKGGRYSFNEAISLRASVSGSKLSATVYEVIGPGDYDPFYERFSSLEGYGQSIVPEDSIEYPRLFSNLPHRITTKDGIVSSASAPGALRIVLDNTAFGQTSRTGSVAGEQAAIVLSLGCFEKSTQVSWPLPRSGLINQFNLNSSGTFYAASSKYKSFTNDTSSREETAGLAATTQRQQHNRRRQLVDDDAVTTYPALDGKAYFLTCPPVLPNQEGSYDLRLENTQVKIISITGITGSADRFHMGKLDSGRQIAFGPRANWKSSSRTYDIFSHSSGFFFVWTSKWTETGGRSGIIVTFECESAPWALSGIGASAVESSSFSTLYVVGIATGGTIVLVVLVVLLVMMVKKCRQPKGILKKGGGGGKDKGKKKVRRAGDSPSDSDKSDEVEEGGEESVRPQSNERERSKRVREDKGGKTERNEERKASLNPTQKGELVQRFFAEGGQFSAAARSAALSKSQTREARVEELARSQSSWNTASEKSTGSGGPGSKSARSSSSGAISAGRQENPLAAGNQTDVAGGGNSLGFLVDTGDDLPNTGNQSGSDVSGQSAAAGSGMITEQELEEYGANSTTQRNLRGVKDRKQEKRVLRKAMISSAAEQMGNYYPPGVHQQDLQPTVQQQQQQQQLPQTMILRQDNLQQHQQQTQLLQQQFYQNQSQHHHYQPPPQHHQFPLHQHHQQNASLAPRAMANASAGSTQSGSDASGGPAGGGFDYHRALNAAMSSVLARPGGGGGARRAVVGNNSVTSTDQHQTSPPSSRKVVKTASFVRAQQHGPPNPLSERDDGEDSRSDIVGNEIVNPQLGSSDGDQNRVGVENAPMIADLIHEPASQQEIPSVGLTGTVPYHSSTTNTTSSIAGASQGPHAHVVMMQQGGSTSSVNRPAASASNNSKLSEIRRALHAERALESNPNSQFGDEVLATVSVGSSSVAGGTNSVSHQSTVSPALGTTSSRRTLTTTTTTGTNSSASPYPGGGTTTILDGTMDFVNTQGSSAVTGMSEVSTIRSGAAPMNGGVEVIGPLRAQQPPPKQQHQFSLPTAEVDADDVEYA